MYQFSKIRFCLIAIPVLYFTLLCFTLSFSSCKEKTKSNDKKNKNNQPKKDSKKNPRIGIQPIGNFPAGYLEASAQIIRDYYGFEVEILKQKPLLTKFDNQKIAKKYNISLPVRYRADSLIAYLKRIKSKKHDYLIGLTAVDITTTWYDEKDKTKIKEPLWLHLDWGIFGLGYCPGSSCLISSFRYYFDTQDYEHVKKRMQKVVLHELGHNLGLPHCEKKYKHLCFMAQVDLKNALLDLDDSSWTLCEECRLDVCKSFVTKLSKTISDKQQMENNTTKK